MTYQPAPERYRGMSYGRCGASGLKLPPLTLGFWQNFGASTPFDTSRDMVRYAFDRGINHFDLPTITGRPRRGGTEFRPHSAGRLCRP